jgi:mannose-6-phosphate isomerase-like protein (cupin superfamily)
MNRKSNQVSLEPYGYAPIRRPVTKPIRVKTASGKTLYLQGVRKEDAQLASDTPKPKRKSRLTHNQQMWFAIAVVIVAVGCLYWAFPSPIRSPANNDPMYVARRQAVAQGSPYTNSTCHMGVVTYDKLMRNADSYVGCNVEFTGKVIQTGSDWSGGWIRVTIDKPGDDFSTDAVFVRYDHNNKILENDHVHVVGSGAGRMSYKTVLGAEMTVPEIDSTFVSLMH